MVVDIQMVLRHLERFPFFSFFRHTDLPVRIFHRKLLFYPEARFLFLIHLHRSARLRIHVNPDRIGINQTFAVFPCHREISIAEKAMEIVGPGADGHFLAQLREPYRNDLPGG